MIVRESPKKNAPSENPIWPPKSPHDALLSSPSGRKKYERRREQGSPSPTPLRRPTSRPQPASEDEDEETLELQLKAIEARLKLKRLQQAKAKETAGDSDSDNVRASSRPTTSLSARRPDLPRPHSAVQVPVSPTREKRPTQEPRSPARVLLGIDKGIKAQDVSLKRAASFSVRGKGSRDTPGFLLRANSRAGGDLGTSAPRGKSFNERLADSRLNDRERQEKQTRIEKARSRGFGLKDIEGLRDADSSRAPSSLSAGTARSAGQDTRSTAAPSRDATLTKSRSLADLKATSTPRPQSNLSSRTETSRAPSTSSFSSKTSSSTLRSNKTATTTTSVTSAETSTNRESTPTEPSSVFESISGLHLTKRLIPHNTLTRTLEGKSIFTVPQLLKEVKSPHYDPPDMENDYVVVGVIASKSSPLRHKNANQVRSTGDKDEDASGPDKFMVLRLTDLKWELDLYLFDTGFSQFWKLSVGTLIAILNPDVMPPRNRDTGKFSLKLTSSEDTVIEIGMARDLGFCKAMRKDGKECGSWVDGRKTEFCDFHVELQVEKSKRGRMEVNTMTGFGKGPGKYGMFGGGSGGQARGRFKDDGLVKNPYGKAHDAGLHETYYVAPSSKSAAQLLDQEDSLDRGVSRAELHRKRLAEKEKERELAEKLGNMGKGAGADYLRLKGTRTPNLPAKGDLTRRELSNPADEKPTSLDNAALDLLANRKADDVSLSPVKRKRNVSGKASEPMGWGGAFKRGLLEPKEDEKKDREPSPTKKKARFMLAEKGIREPGRDSLGGLDVGLLAAMDEDDDDGLDII